MKSRNLKLALRIALVHLLSKKKQTLVAMLGVTFGISMFIVMISFMNGVNDFLMELTLDGSPHVRIYNPVKIDRPSIAENYFKDENTWLIVRHQKPKQELPKLKDGPKILADIRATPGILVAAPQLSTQAFFNNGPIQYPGNILGIDVMAENTLVKLGEKIEEGSLEKLITNKDGILLGEKLAEKMDLTVGDRVSITLPNGTNILFKVVGIFSFGMTAIDETRCYANLETVQKIMGKSSDYFTDINLKLINYQAADLFAKEMQQKYNYQAEDWMAANASILAGEMIRNTMTYVVALTMLVVAGFGIYNIMNMTIINKMRDIAIMKATGFESGNIVSIFLIQSLLIGILGGLLGLLLGSGISYMISLVPFPAKDVIKLDTFPVSFKWQYYALGMLFGFLTTLLAGYFPAKKASKIDPIAIIRG